MGVSSAPMRPICGLSSSAPRARTTSALAAVLVAAPASGPPGSPNPSPIGSGRARTLSQVTSAALTTIDDVEARLRERAYIGDRALATAIFLALQLEKPLFIE